MPIIAEHHKWKDKDHIADLRDDWPEDCYVQWGHGVVLGRDKARTTAFFEAFPKEGGFIRGEGATIVEAEADAHGRFLRESACNHQWSRKNYTNGGCICRRCGAFQSVMKPITRIGAFRDPISIFEISNTIESYGLGPDPYDTQETRRLKRKTWLRLRLAGFDLPELPDTILPIKGRVPGRSEYAKACADAFFGRFESIADIDELRRERGGGPMAGLLDATTYEAIKSEYLDWREEQLQENETTDIQPF